MGRAIIEHIGFFGNQRRNRGMPDKCSFQNRDSEHKTARMHARTVLLDFYNQPAYHQWLWEETSAGTASQVSDDHFFTCILLLACSSGAAICQSAVCGITTWSNFLLQNEMEGAGRIWIQEESLPSLPESLPVSFNTQSSSQWHLSIAAYFRKSHFSIIHIPYANSRPSIERIIWSSSTSLCSSFHTGEFLSICSSIPHFCLSFLPFSKSSAPHWRMPSHLTFILFRFPFGELFIWMPSQFFLNQTQHFCSRMHTPCSHRYVWGGFGLHEKDLSQSPTHLKCSLTRHTKKNF